MFSFQTGALLALAIICLLLLSDGNIRAMIRMVEDAAKATPPPLDAAGIGDAMRRLDRMRWIQRSCWYVAIPTALACLALPFL